MTKEEEIIWCLGDWAEDTDYVLCEWDIDLLPTLYEKDEIRYDTTSELMTGVELVALYLQQYECYQI